MTADDDADVLNVFVLRGREAMLKPTKKGRRFETP